MLQASGEQFRDERALLTPRMNILKLDHFALVFLY